MGLSLPKTIHFGVPPWLWRPPESYRTWRNSMRFWSRREAPQERREETWIMYHQWQGWRLVASTFAGKMGKMWCEPSGNAISLQGYYLVWKDCFLFYAACGFLKHCPKRRLQLLDIWNRKHFFSNRLLFLYSKQYLIERTASFKEELHFSKKESTDFREIFHMLKGMLQLSRSAVFFG